MPLGASKRATLYVGPAEAAQSLAFMTGPFSPSGHECLLNGANAGTEAFDGNPETRVDVGLTSAGLGLLERKVPSALRIAEYGLHADGAGAWILDGFANGAWRRLDERSGLYVTTLQRFRIDGHARADCTRFRWSFTAASSASNPVVDVFLYKEL